MGDDAELAAAWGAAIGTTHAATAWFDEILGRHRGPHRRYHGLRHVVWVVRHAHSLAGAVDLEPGVAFDLGAVTAAAFFHDAIYDVAASDNEERSAALAVRALGQLGWDDHRRAVVAGLVRATAGHVAPVERAAEPSAAEYAVLLDADLAVLGSEPASYSAYAAGVRAEYAAVSDGAWAAGRGAVLRALLARPALYESDEGRSRWEHQARANLTAELAGLSRAG